VSLGSFDVYEVEENRCVDGSLVVDLRLLERLTTCKHCWQVLFEDILARILLQASN
jgi:hypothetical protein